MERKKLDEFVESLIAHRQIKTPLGSMDDRVGRRYDKTGKVVYESVKELKKRQKDFSGENSHASLIWEDEKLAAARALRLSIEEFKQKYPEHGKILEEIIDKQRSERRVYVKFGLNEGCKLPIDIYLQVLESIGIKKEVAERLYEPLMESGSLLRRGKEEREYTLLIKE